jgi:hypothetical protein
MKMPICEDVTVKLVGEDGNAFFILGRVSKEMKRNKVPKDVINDFMKEAMEGDYNHLLRTCMKYVNVE